MASLDELFNEISLDVVDKPFVLPEDYGKAFKAGVGDVLSSLGSGLGWLEAKAPVLPFGKVSEALGSFGENITSGAGYYEVPESGPERYLLELTRSTPSLLALMGSSLATGGTAAALGLGRAPTIIASVLGSRPLESLMNAGEVFDQAKANGLSDEEAVEAAGRVFGKDFMTGAVLDTLQYGVTFGKALKMLNKAVPKEEAVKAAEKSLKPVVKAALRALGVSATDILSEGLEEGLQTRHAVEALTGEVPLWTSPEVKESATLGGLMGGLFSGAGAVADVTSELAGRASRQGVGAPRQVLTPPPAEVTPLQYPIVPSTAIAAPESFARPPVVPTAKREVTTPPLVPVVTQEPGLEVGPEVPVQATPEPAVETLPRVPVELATAPATAEPVTATTQEQAPETPAEAADIVGLKVKVNNKAGEIVRADSNGRVRVKFKDGATRTYKSTSPAIQEAIARARRSQGEKKVTPVRVEAERQTLTPAGTPVLERTERVVSPNEVAVTREVAAAGPVIEPVPATTPAPLSALEGVETQPVPQVIPQRLEPAVETVTAPAVATPTAIAPVTTIPAVAAETQTAETQTAVPTPPLAQESVTQPVQASTGYASPVEILSSLEEEAKRIRTHRGRGRTATIAGVSASVERLKNGTTRVVWYVDSNRASKQKALQRLQELTQRQQAVPTPPAPAPGEVATAAVVASAVTPEVVPAVIPTATPASASEVASVAIPETAPATQRRAGVAPQQVPPANKTAAEAREAVQVPKSKGHVEFIEGREYFFGDDGHLYSADITVPVGGDGRRPGEWQARPEEAEAFLDSIRGTSRPQRLQEPARQQEPVKVKENKVTQKRQLVADMHSKAFWDEVFKKASKDLDAYKIEKTTEQPGRKLVSLDDVARSLPTANLEQRGDLIAFELPNGMVGVIDPDANILINQAAVERAYGRPLSDDDIAVGVWKKVNNVHIIALAGELADQKVLNHEVMEMAMRTVLTPDEVATLRDYFRADNSEAIADGYADFVVNRERYANSVVGRIFQKILDFFRNIKANLLGEGAEDIMRRIQSGGVWYNAPLSSEDFLGDWFKISRREGLDINEDAVDNRLGKIIAASKSDDPKVKKLHDMLTSRPWVVMTAENPSGMTLSAEENLSRMTQLKRHLDRSGYRYIEVDGYYDGPEHSLLVYDIPLTDALNLAKQFQQESILCPSGLVYSDGRFVPFDKDAAMRTGVGIDNYYSEVVIDDERVRFQLPLSDEEYYLLEHYGKTPELSELDPAYSGTGKKGTEDWVRSTYPELFKNRLYFYAVAPARVEYGLGPHRYICKVPSQWVADFSTRNSPTYKQLLNAALEIYKANRYDGVDANGSNLRAINNISLPIISSEQGNALLDTIMQHLAVRDGYKVIKYPGGFISFYPLEASYVDRGLGRLTPIPGESAAYKVKKRDGLDVEIADRLPASALKYIIPEEYEGRWTKATVDSFLNFYKSLPSAEEIAAWSATGRIARGWYQASKQAIDTLFGIDAPRFTLLLAATSPNNNVRSNLLNSIRFWVAWEEAGRPTDVDTVQKLALQNIRSFGVRSLLNNIVTAVTADDPLTARLSGPKVHSFARNLLGYYQHVTLDRHMARQLSIPQTALARSGEIPGYSPAYLAGANKFRQAADVLTAWTGEVWTPMEAQETSWLLTRELAQRLRTGASTGELNVIAELKKLTPEMLYENVDNIARLLNDSVVEEILRRSGYGTRLEQARGAGTAGIAESASTGVRGTPVTEGEAGTGLSTKEYWELLDRTAQRIELSLSPNDPAYKLIKKSELHKPSEVRQLIEQHSGEKVVDTAQEDTRSFKDKVTDTVRRLYTAWVDELYPLLYKLKDKGLYDYAWVELRGAVGRAESLIRYGKSDSGVKSLLEIFQDIPENEIIDFMQYVTDRHLQSLAKAREEGFAPKVEQLALSYEEYKRQADEILALRPGWEEKRQQLLAFQREVLKFLLDGGVISQETYDAYLKYRPDYVPLMREFDVEDFDTFVSRKGVVNIANPIKTLKGSKRNVVNPLLQIVKNTYTFAEIGARNSVGQEIARMVERGEIAPEVISPATSSTPNTPERKVFFVWENGEKKYFSTEPDLYRVLSMPDKGYTSIVAKALRAPTQVLRIGATRSPDFMVRNMIRDAVSAAIYSENGFIPFYDNFRGLMSVIGQDETFMKFMQSGAAQSVIANLDRNYLRENFYKMLKKKGGLKLTSFLNPRNALDVLTTMAEYSELSTRLGEFKRALEKGKSPEQAALEARDVTLDFHRWGTLGKTANQYVAFMNAGIQGIDKMLRSFYDYLTPGKSPSGRVNPATFKRALLFVTVPSIVTMIANLADPERRDIYEEIPQWQKDLFWIYIKKNPKDLKKSTIIRIPKPFEIGIIFGSLPERFVQWMFLNDRDAFRKLGDTFSNFAPGVLPTAMVPIIEWMTNYSFFRERRIVPMAEEKLPAEQQSGPYTTETAKALAILLENTPVVRSMAEFSPRKIDNLLISYTGGLGQYVLTALDVPAKMLTGSPQRPLPRVIEATPGVKGLTYTPYASPESIQRFYDVLDEVSKEVLGKRGMRQHSRLEPLYKELTKINTDLGKLRKRIKMIQYAKNMSREEKRKQIDIINQRMIRLARRGLQYYDKYGRR